MWPGHVRLVSVQSCSCVEEWPVRAEAPRAWEAKLGSGSRSWPTAGMGDTCLARLASGFTPLTWPTPPIRSVGGGHCTQAMEGRTPVGSRRGRAACRNQACVHGGQWATPFPEQSAPQACPQGRLLLALWSWTIQFGPAQPLGGKADPAHRRLLPSASASCPPSLVLSRLLWASRVLFPPALRPDLESSVLQ